jgi:hypothetical protein
MVLPVVYGRWATRQRGSDAAAMSTSPCPAEALVLEAPRRLVVRAEDLLATMAGERDDVPPVHGVLTP